MIIPPLRFLICSAGLRTVCKGYELQNPLDVLDNVDPPGLPWWPRGQACFTIDLRLMPDKNRLAREAVSTHLGTNALLIDHLVRARGCKGFLLQALSDLKNFIRNAPKDDNCLLILAACDWGKHRSVAMAWVLDNLLKSLGHHTRVWHLNEGRWGRHSCGVNPCSGCDRDNAQKMGLNAEVRAHWERLFDP